MVIDGREQKAHFQCLDLPHSDDCFVLAFPTENTEAFLEGHKQAFDYFGGVPPHALQTIGRELISNGVWIEVTDPHHPFNWTDPPRII